MRLVLAAVLALFVALPGFAQDSEDDWFQGKPIRRVAFDGLKNIRPSELEGITEPYVGREFTDEIFWELFSRLWALEYFDEITPATLMADPEGNEVALRFTVTEKPIISRINFIGNSGIRRNELLDLVATKVNEMATPARLRIDELAIINRYLEKGFPDIRVRSEISEGQNSTIAVNFHIDEGEKIVIEAFLFEGASVFSHRTLRSQLSLRTRGIIADGAFQESRLVADIQALAQYYRDRGFIDARVVDTVREVRRDDRGNNLMTITFMIYEGGLYDFGGITFEGNNLFSDERLSGLILSRVGERVNDRRLQADLARVADLYFEHGYIFNSFVPVENRDSSSGILSYHIVITERGRAHIEDIIVRGNVKTKDHVILREIPLEPGDIFSRARVMDGLRNLYNLQYFSAVTPETPPGSADALMNLVINVEEAPTMDVQFGLSFSGSADPDTFPMSVMGRWSDKNFMGSGNMIGAELSLSPDTQSGSIGFTHNWVGGRPFSLSYDLSAQHMSRRTATNNSAPFFQGDEDYAFPDGFNSREEYEAAGRIPPDAYLMPYNQWRISTGVSSGYRWPTFLGNLGVGGGVRVGITLNSFDNEIYRPFDPVFRDMNNQWRPATSFWTSVSLDQRDVFFDPSSGYYAVQRASYHGILPVEIEKYIRTDTRLQWFYTLFNIPVTEGWSFRAVFGINSAVSFIWPHFGEPRPLIEDASMLAVDGMFIGRGWNGEFRRKGLALWDNWAEIRVPLVPGFLAWDFFFDAAGVKNTPRDLFSEFGTPDNLGYFFMRFSLGGGLRFTIPQFPFRFSLAKRFLIRDDGQVEWQTGSLWNGNRQGKGLDFVVSFAISTF